MRLHSERERNNVSLFDRKSMSESFIVNCEYAHILANMFSVVRRLSLLWSLAFKILSLVM